MPRCHEPLSLTFFVCVFLLQYQQKALQFPPPGLRRDMRMRPHRENVNGSVLRESEGQRAQTKEDPKSYSTVVMCCVPRVRIKEVETSGVRV